MAEKSEKFLSFDKFKERVYKNIGTLESLENEYIKEVLKDDKRGCFGVFITPLVSGIVLTANKTARKQFKIEELNAKADEILAQKEIKGLICEKLDATVVLPIDAAYKITPVLYGLALEDEEKVPFDSMLFAIICRKITSESVEKFCGQTAPEEKDKGKKTSAKKPAGD